jgi:hypothetical protein
VTDTIRWQVLLVTAGRLYILLPQKLLFGPQISTLIVSFPPVHRLPFETSKYCFCCHGDDTRLMKVTAERASIVLNYKVKYNYLFHAVQRVVAAAVYGASKLGRFLMERWLYNRTYPDFEVTERPAV